MARNPITPTNVERTLGAEELVVSKTDLRGIITYANDVFCRMAGYTEDELLGQPHNLIRHPDMPACVFKLLWDTLRAEKEIFAYVVNLAKDGSHYWVFAHVTPSRDTAGRVVGYHSNRRAPYADAITKVQNLYAELRALERRAVSRDAGLRASTEMLESRLREAGKSYGEFVFSLSAHTRLGGPR